MHAVQFEGAHLATDRSSAVRVLVVETDPALRTVIQEVCTDAGYGVLVASAGCETLQLAIEHEPAVIVLDGDFAGLSGWTVLSELRSCERTRHIPVLAITAVPERIPQPITVQLDAVLGKPFDVCLLEDQLRWVLQPGPSGDTPTTGPVHAD